MDKHYIRSVWEKFLEVQEKKNKLDPVGKEDGDIDNDGDKDSSDEYLANRRKKVGAAMKKEGKLPPALQKAIDKKNGKKTDDDDEDVKESEGSYPAPKKVKKPGDALEPVNNRTAKLKEEEGPYPTPKKVKKPGDALEPVNNRTAKLKEEDKEECPKCEGKGCSHCDDKGYHVKESTLDTSLFSERELAALEERMETAGATAPEGLMDKESAGSKKFAKDHKKSNAKFENIPAQAAADASKSGKATKQSAARNAGDNLNNGDSKTPGKV